MIDIDLEAQAPTDRVRAWKRLLDENLMGVECTNAGDDLRASVKLRPLDSGTLTRARFTRQTLSRTPELIRQSTEETMLLAFVQEGKHVIRQGGKSATLEGRGIYVLDGSRPFEVDFASEQTVQATIHVPKAAVTKRIGAREVLAFAPGSPLQKLVSTFAEGMLQSLEAFDSETLDTLLNQTLDLFALMATQQTGASLDPSTHRAGMRLRLRSYVDAHLRDDDLTLERTARALGFATGDIRALFESEGTSFERYLHESRLERARREIMDPRRTEEENEIAVGWGFKDASRFARAFQAKYGMSPRDAKGRH